MIRGAPKDEPAETDDVDHTTWLIATTP